MLNVPIIALSQCDWSLTVINTSLTLHHIVFYAIVTVMISISILMYACRPAQLLYLTPL